jgi:hypothetical protein
MAAPHGTATKEIRLSSNHSREEIRLRTVHFALDWLRRVLMDPGRLGAGGPT